MFNETLLSCKHSELTVKIAEAFLQYKKTHSLDKSEMTKLIREVILFLDQRCKDVDSLPSYRMFMLNKAQKALEIVHNIQVQKPEGEEYEELIDIPVEEFEDAKFDEDFDKLIGYHE